MTFEQRVQRLEEIVQALESRDIGLEQGLKLFEEGIACLRDATADLSRVEASVQILRQHADGVIEATDLRG